MALACCCTALRGEVRVQGKTIHQSITEGHGNVQIGKVVICDPSRGSQCHAPPSTANERMTPEQRAELTHIALQIELAEEGLVNAGTVWDALCAHLNGRGLDDNSELKHEQYWEARSYLDGWLACARGDNLPRSTMVRQIMRMWRVRKGLQASTLAYCEDRFGARSLTALSNSQLRAALWTTVADWHAYWSQMQAEPAHPASPTHRR
ncbi:hypothetical protein LPV64_10900, partial [Ralstonia pseudosolanacearum]|uniref:Uncharacterized protein n=1 Tax=Ralstonia solanacearum TaxID=305 RepID=A0A0S4V2M3_RALSL|nr:hypothetical protein [Ralstonia pseudosolanacearum]CUV28915.1 conserved protein of unknown function [Ralstonia solanacearum]